MLIRVLALSLPLFSACVATPTAYNLSDPLPSWNPGPVKQRIQVFVKEITDPQSASFVQPQDRIAAFDNDGTLWCEKPIYIQLAFIVSRLRILASERTELQNEQPFKAAWEGDMAYLEELDVETILSSALSAHAGMTQVQFMRWAKGFLDGAKHPRFQVPYRRLVYQPMRELMEYLAASGSACSSAPAAAWGSSAPHRPSCTACRART